MINVIEYRRPNGRSPYGDFRETVAKSGKQQILARIDAAIRKLAEVGSHALVEINTAEKMNDVWQLRVGPFRVFYFLDESQRTYILLNGYRKATQKAPRGVLEMAEGLRQDYLSAQRRR